MYVEILTHRELYSRYIEENLEDEIKYLNEDTILPESSFFNMAESENFFFLFN